MRKESIKLHEEDKINPALWQNPSTALFKSFYVVNIDIATVDAHEAKLNLTVTSRYRIFMNVRWTVTSIEESHFCSIEEEVLSTHFLYAVSATSSQGLLFLPLGLFDRVVKVVD